MARPGGQQPRWGHQQHPAGAQSWPWGAAAASGPAGGGPPYAVPPSYAALPLPFYPEAAPPQQFTASTVAVGSGKAPSCPAYGVQQQNGFHRTAAPPLYGYSIERPGQGQVASWGPPQAPWGPPQAPYCPLPQHIQGQQRPGPTSQRHRQQQQQQQQQQQWQQPPPPPPPQQQQYYPAPQATSVCSLHKRGHCWRRRGCPDQHPPELLGCEAPPGWVPPRGWAPPEGWVAPSWLNAWAYRDLQQRGVQPAPAAVAAAARAAAAIAAAGQAPFPAPPVAARAGAAARAAWASAAPGAGAVAVSAPAAMPSIRARREPARRSRAAGTPPAPGGPAPAPTVSAAPRPTAAFVAPPAAPSVAAPAAMPAGGKGVSVSATSQAAAPPLPLPVPLPLPLPLPASSKRAAAAEEEEAPAVQTPPCFVGSPPKQLGEMLQRLALADSAEIESLSGSTAAAAAASPEHPPPAPSPAAATPAAATAAGLDPCLFDDLCCPITQEPMGDPVVAADGVTYERAAIAAWLAKLAAAGQAYRSPLTGAPLADPTLRPNLAVRGMAAALQAAGLLPS